jgi:hypothetical protein
MPDYALLNTDNKEVSASSTEATDETETIVHKTSDKTDNLVETHNNRRRDNTDKNIFIVHTNEIYIYNAYDKTMQPLSS